MTKRIPVNNILLAKKMRQSVLQAAIEGKLTEQDTSKDGNAKDLLAKIKTEKERLIADGEIKKPKALPSITEDEIPFDIPDNWEWVRLGDVTIVNPRNKAEDNKDSAFVPMKLMDGGYRNSFTFETKKWKSIKKGYTHFAENDIVFAKITPCFQNLKSSIIKDIPNKVGAGTTEFHVLRNFADHIVPEYILYFVKNPFFINNGVATFTGTAGQQRVSTDFVKEYMFPLPPLAEQKRIVTKLENILAQIDALEVHENELYKLQSAFPNQMQNSLLQAAIEGKLTERNPEEDGSVTDLLAQIETEKERLIADGEIKRPKALPSITEDEIPFDIPDNWKWVRLGDFTFNRGQKKPDTEFTYIDISSIDNKKQKLNGDLNVLRASKAPSRARKIVDVGDIIYSTVRPYLMNIVILDKEITPSPIVSTGFAVITTNIRITNKYLFFVLMSPHFNSYANHIENAKGVAYPAINDTRLNNGLIPLPPLSEQKRIVELLEKLLPEVQELKNVQ